MRSGRLPSINAIRKAAKYMGYMSIREEQTKAVKGILSGRDVFVCLPTGYGKTLCYSILPKAFDFISDSCSKSTDCTDERSSESIGQV